MATHFAGSAHSYEAQCFARNSLFGKMDENALKS